MKKSSYIIISFFFLLISINESSTWAFETLLPSNDGSSKAKVVEVALKFPDYEPADPLAPDPSSSSKSEHEFMDEEVSPKSDATDKLTDKLTDSDTSLLRPHSPLLDYKEDRKEIEKIRFQLRFLKFNPSGNNALFLGRTQDQGADAKNLGFLTNINNPLNDTTQWFFIDSEERTPKSFNDIVVRTDTLINLIIHGKIEDKFLNQFKVIVIDSGAAGYILTNALLDKLISWAHNGPESILIFENIPSKVYTTCSISPGSFPSLPDGERKKKMA
jgi:hypothetical protein